MMTPSLPPLTDLLAERAWIRSLARALVRDAALAEDVAQETWVTALARPPKQGPRLRGWLRRVVQSRAVDQHRKRTQDQRRIERLAPKAEAPTPQALLEAARLQGAVARAVGELPEPYRLTVLLTYFEGHSARAIAERTDVPVATVRTRLARAHEKLRVGLQREQPASADRQRHALWLLAFDRLPSAPAGPTVLKTTAMGVAMHTSHKLLAGAAVLLLGLIGGLAGNWIGRLSGSDETTRAAESLHVDGQPQAKPTADADLGPTLDGTPSTSRSAWKSLREAFEATKQDLAKESEATRSAMSKLQAKLDALLRQTIERNEIIALATARNVISAHAQVQQSGRIDTDRDGTGEFGGFHEMSAGGPGRMAKRLIPPVLASRFRKLTSGGSILHNGYHYRIYLPGAGGVGVGEPPTGFKDDGSIDADLAETTWCLYAWPDSFGVSGTRTFMTNQGGDVLWTEDAKYSGASSGPRPDAAFAEQGSIAGRAAIGQRGQDGNQWKVGG